MRHVLVNIFTYVIAFLIFVGSAFFARMRSSQYALTVERQLLAAYEPVPAHEFRWAELGAATYDRNCAACHGRAGRGWDQYPAVHDAAALAALPGGRDYLVDLHLYGLTSRRSGAPMPPMRHLHDVQIAAVLNYIMTTFGTAPHELLFVPADVAARRGRQESPRDVDRRRPGGQPD